MKASGSSAGAATIGMYGACPAKPVQVRIPKVGWVRFRWSRAVPDEVKSFRVKRDRAGRWHVAFAVIPPPIDEPGTGAVIGVDRGVVVSAALSTGELLTVPGLREAEARRLRRLQHPALARAARGSNRRTRLKAGSPIEARETDRRTDWVEQTSTHLARHFDHIRVEDLKIKNMVRSARGTIATPGTNVRAGTRTQPIHPHSRMGPSGDPPGREAPGRVEKINPAYTSRPVTPAGIAQQRIVRAKRSFAVAPAGTPITRT